MQPNLPKTIPTGSISPDHLDPSHLGGRTVLSIWAHPDDESYLAGGLMAAVTAGGGRVVHVTATLGEHGTSDPVAEPPAVVAGIRGRELEAALAAVGVDESIALGFEDGTLDRIDPALGTRRLATIISAMGPDVVVSFGPDGVTGHPDHIAVADWTRRAVSGRHDPPALLTAAGRTAMPPDLDAAMEAAGAYFPTLTHDTPASPAVVLDPIDLDAKLDALAAHESQTAGLIQRLGPVDYRRLAAVEAFHPANEAAIDLISGPARASVA